MKQNCEFLQIYIFRIKFRETISKISFHMSTIYISYQLKTLRESFTRVTDIDGHSAATSSGATVAPLHF